MAGRKGWQLESLWPHVSITLILKANSSKSLMEIRISKLQGKDSDETWSWEGSQTRIDCTMI